MIDVNLKVNNSRKRHGDTVEDGPGTPQRSGYTFYLFYNRRVLSIFNLNPDH